ncbi:hypothetical protein [Pseudodesulfovibrio sp.]|uniref:hypothetical protein n=1 Tax=unclassified Pseudodesulfovibrio TaxID=2661612 RepID=UPI003AFF6FBA
MQKYRYAAGITLRGSELTTATIGVAAAITTEAGIQHPRGWLAQRAIETTTEWVARLAEAGVEAVEVLTDYDATRYTGGDTVETVVDGVVQIHPSPVLIDGIVDTVRDAKLADIDAALAVLDEATVRPLRAILAADAAGEDRSPDDLDKLVALEASATILRETRASVAAMTDLEDIDAVTVE